MNINIINTLQGSSYLSILTKVCIYPVTYIGGRPPRPEPMVKMQVQLNHFMYIIYTVYIIIVKLNCAIFICIIYVIIITNTQLPKICMIMAMSVALCLNSDKLPKLAHSENNLYIRNCIYQIPITYVSIQCTCP